MKKMLLLSLLLVVTSSAAAQQARPNPEIFNQFRDAETGKQLEMDPEVQKTLQQVLLQRISEFCKSPEGQQAGKCGRAKAASTDDTQEVATDRR